MNYQQVFLLEFPYEKMGNNHSKFTFQECCQDWSKVLPFCLHLMVTSCRTHFQQSEWPVALLDFSRSVVSGQANASVWAFIPTYIFLARSKLALMTSFPMRPILSLTRQNQRLSYFIVSRSIQLLHIVLYVYLNGLLSIHKAARISYFYCYLQLLAECLAQSMYCITVEGLNVVNYLEI